MRTSTSILAFIIDVLMPFKKFVTAQISIAIIWAIDISFRPYLVKAMLDRIHLLQSNTAFKTLLWPAIFYILASILILVVFRFYDYIRLNFIPNLKKQIGIKLMDRMMDHSHGLYQNSFSGNISNKINDLITSTPVIIQIAIDKFFGNMLALLIAIYALYYVSPKFSLAMGVWALLFLIFSFKLSHKAKILANKNASFRSIVFGHIVDIVSNIMSVRFFLGKKRELKLLDNTFSESVQAEQKLDWVFLIAHGLQGGSFIIFQAFCLWMLILGLDNKSITPGDFALVLTLNISITDCLWSLSQDFREFTSLIGNISKALQLIQSPIEIENKPNCKEMTIKKGEIVFDNVHFNYKDAEPIFENKFVTIFSGQKVGLVGYSGSGKTTFVNLILRLFEITSGKIFIDGQSIDNITQESLRNAISIIPQDPYLFHRSIMENIRYGKMNASDEEVIEAAKLAHAHKFIVKLPQQYKSLVGERGVKLSGGQRQRIAIARAILKNAPILILDEATSQLDSVTEEYIQRSLHKLMKNKTAIVIAHRLSTLLHMDRILVFDQGEIIEDGNHEELLANNGTYKTLWNAQIGGFLPENRKI